jgi:sugar/nucleoside kinase (ribokinase family)
VEQQLILVLSASFFNVQSAIVSVVGDDFPQEYLDLLTSRNIDISGLEVVQGGKTFFGAVVTTMT